MLSRGPTTANRAACGYGQIMNWLMICSLCCSMIFSENRFPLFRIMLYVRSTATTDATAAINARTVAMADHRVCRAWSHSSADYQQVR